MLSTLAKAIFELRTSTGGEAFFDWKGFDATKFVLLSVFTII